MKSRKREDLSYEEILLIVKAAVELGVRKIRITGGEPLARDGIVAFIALLGKIEGLADISLTTNGLLLEDLAKPLAKAGLKRINVSLDSLKTDKYRQITRGGSLAKVLKGIKEAARANLIPLKINNVPIKGLNDDEIEAFASLTIHTPYHVRFIEFMPIGASQLWTPGRCLKTEEIKSTAETIGPLFPVKVRKYGPARYYRYKNALGVVGFISPISHHFCNDCNRLRITSDGKIRPCLFSDLELDLKPALKQRDAKEEIKRLLQLSVQTKPERHRVSGKQKPLHMTRSMYEIGG